MLTNRTGGGRVVLCDESVMSQWLYNMIMDRVVRVVHVRVFEQGVGLQCVESCNK